MINTPREWDRIQRIKSLVQRHHPHTKVPIGDDAFVFENFPGDSVIAQDLLVEEIHFKLAYFAAADLGHKALAVNLSDLASMGATPHFAQVSLALPTHLTESWLDDFYRGMVNLADRFGVEIVGGDLSASPQHLFIDVSVHGSCQKALTRTGAKAGDLLFSSGPLGLSQVGLMALNESDHTEIFSKARLAHLRPEPRLDLLPFLEENADSIHALMDSSDGLINDALLLCGNTRGLELTIHEELFDDSLLAAKERFKQNPLDILLWGGENYELLACVPSEHAAKFSNWQCFGKFLDTPGIYVVESGNRSAIDEYKGWRHFNR